MSGATPKSQAKEPIQLDIVIVCRKRANAAATRPSISKAMDAARSKIDKLYAAGFDLSRNDRKIVLFGQMMTTLTRPEEAAAFAIHSEEAIDSARRSPSKAPIAQPNLFD